MAPKYISKVAIVGAAGHLGTYLANALLSTGTHTVTALTRKESTASPPSGTTVIRVDYSNEAELIAALQGIDFLIITLNATAPPETHTLICKAAGKAGVPYIMPNAHGSDPRETQLQNESLFGPIVQKNIADVTSAGATYVVLGCSVWYEWSLALGENFFGFDVANRKGVLVDGGDVVLSSSTFEQCGRAVAALLSLPVESEDGGPALRDYDNKPVLFHSFRVTQRDMLDSLHRVLGTTDKDWVIEERDSKERREEGLKELQEGNRMGFAKAMYSRYLSREGGADFGKKPDLAMNVLGLKEESVDEATKRVVEMVKSGWKP
ncbi:NAD(P)-binding protein [Corynespora cassiicola Philippines]|uniref:NAD(P)-binding protein n=1 Tax=Corynespora cassiicola Philippines TaxID=1448308 RepID=A0A2T2PBW1_CORCC|nr:NAD(P)-binding protein [Corynespora cassiicola Philippines]